MTLPLAPFGPRTGLRGVVAAADQLAASAGTGILARGGSAADAAVATGAVMAVVGPHLCGLGGDVLAMVAPPGRPPEALLSVGRASAGSDAARLRAEGMTVMPLRGDVRSVPVPGAVDGWLALHQRHGRLPLDEDLAAAIELAEDGFAASVMLALASHLVHALPGAGELCPDGPLQVGQRVRLPGIARTLRAIAHGGRAAFYEGEFGRGLLGLGAGHFAPSDLATSSARWCAPLRQPAWGHVLWTVPPPSQGYLTLAGAAVAEASGLGTDPDDPRWAHLLVEAWRAVGHDRPAVLFDGADGDALLHTDRLAAATARIDRDRAAPPDVAPGRGTVGPTVGRVGEGDTTHLCALDADGLGVSLTQSNALDFGSHLVEPATGVFLHNRGVGFSLEEGSPAELAPGRRPPHTLSPMLATA
ncbi:MAG: gamma-glutamyltransferase, partial [Acidimicrobiales bacterium]|nr:gamma-glutamyltransferase [Acidimicrobiales bacterium]